MLFRFSSTIFLKWLNVCLSFSFVLSFFSFSGRWVTIFIHLIKCLVFYFLGISSYSIQFCYISLLLKYIGKVCTYEIQLYTLIYQFLKFQNSYFRTTQSKSIKHFKLGCFLIIHKYDMYCTQARGEKSGVYGPKVSLATSIYYILHILMETIKKCLFCWYNNFLNLFIT